MDDTGPVRRFERFGDLTRDRDGFLEWNRPLGDTFRESRSFNELEDERVFFRSVDGGDVRVVERREHLRFATKPGETLRVRREILGQHFDRDVSSELGVACAVDFTHTAGADGVHVFVGTETRAGR